jgi:signal peptidase I
METDVQTPETLSSVVYEWLHMVVRVTVVCLLVLLFVARIVSVDGSSMLPTLQHGDRMIVSNVLFEPSYGDVVVLVDKDYMSKPLVKRVIATEGQTVDIDYSAGYVLIDGVPLYEPYIYEQMLSRYGIEFPLTVPDDYIFVMGDNRNNSSDGRVFGPVDKREVLGRVYVVTWPLSNWKVIK